MKNNDLFCGIQIAPHSLLDEGVEYCLDLLKETAGINTLLLSTYNYYGAMGRPKEVLADHGVPLRNNTKRLLPKVWVRHHKTYFTETVLRHAAVDPDAEYAGRDLIKEMVEPARERSIKLYVRWYQPGGVAKSCIENWDKVLTVDIYGKQGGRPCWFNPEYLKWLAATMRDLFENYPLDGVQYGAERKDSITEMLAWGTIPNCFCSHCQVRARSKGIDIEKARDGFIKLERYVSSLRKGEISPSDGVFTTLLRILMQNAELLKWNQLFFDGSEKVHRLVYDTVKQVRPEAQVGRHVDHRQTSWGMVYRAALEYSRMADYADFIKPILYHDILGPRIRGGRLEPLKQTIFQELSLEQSLGLYYAFFGHDPSIEPKLEELTQRGLSSEYVYRETKRFVAGVKKKAVVYPGIGMDIPKGCSWGTDKWQSDPENIYKAVIRAFDAGAEGVVASREYEEITQSSLRALGKAINQIIKRRS
jgi:hypothetical protein